LKKKTKRWIDKKRIREGGRTLYRRVNRKEKDDGGRTPFEKMGTRKMGRKPPKKETSKGRGRSDVLWKTKGEKEVMQRGKKKV